jgi:hypothetical protein
LAASDESNKVYIFYNDKFLTNLTLKDSQ